MLESQLKNVPEEQKQKIFKAVGENPDFFKTLAEEIKKEMASGKNQMAAAMAVIEKNKEKLSELFKG